MFQENIIIHEHNCYLHRSYTCHCLHSQVRFSAGLPPTRPSRYGPDDEENPYHSCYPNKPQLLRGSAVSPNYCWRQVNRLLERTSSPQTSSESTILLEGSDGGGEGRSEVGRGGREVETASQQFYLSIRFVC